MKAIAKTSPALGVEIVDVPMPKPGPDELLVKVAACGICGSDLHIYLWELGADRAFPRCPPVIGHEPAGEVVEVGEGCHGFKAGDHVALDPFGHCGRCPAPAAPGVSISAHAGPPRRCVRRIRDRAGRAIPSGAEDDGHGDRPRCSNRSATGLHAVEESSLAAGDSCVIEGPGRSG